MFQMNRRGVNLTLQLSKDGLIIGVASMRMD
jgi:hypothetical protein